MGSAFTCSNFQISIESNYVDFVKVHKSKKKKKNLGHYTGMLTSGILSNVLQL